MINLNKCFAFDVLLSLSHLGKVTIEYNRENKMYFIAVANSPDNYSCFAVDRDEMAECLVDGWSEIYRKTIRG